MLIVGGGVAGMAAAKSLADEGVGVYLIDRETALGGWASKLCCKATSVCTKCAVCLATRELEAVRDHRLVTVLTRTTLTRLAGRAGDFAAEVLQEPQYVDPTRCIACGMCADACSMEPKAIAAPTPEAVPYSYLMDETRCGRFRGEDCTLCSERCPTGAIRFDRQPKRERLSVGAVILATGFDVFDAKQMGRLGYGRCAGVMTGLDMEQTFSREGTLRLDGHDGGGASVAFIQCVGSRDSRHGYCSQVCCKYAMRLSLMIKEQDPSAQVTVFYIDVQHAGKGFAGFYQACQDKIRFVQGVPVEVLEAPSGKLEVRFEHIAEAKVDRALFDKVVLSTGMVARGDSWDLASRLGINVDACGFFESRGALHANETHVDGVLVAGACQGPKDIPDSIADGTAAAARAMEVLGRCQSRRPSFSAIAGTASGI